MIDPERQIQEPEFLNNIGLWRNITNTLQEHWCSRDPVECQHFDSDFSASHRQYDDGTARYFTRFMMFRKHVNGEQIKREWLMYSPSSGNVYCFPCILLRDADKGNQTQFCDGFADWKNASLRMQVHKNSVMHQSTCTLQSPCAAHSLNLVGVSAAESCVNAITFFGLVQKNCLISSLHQLTVGR